jgi:hypothetical protein
LLVAAKRELPLPPRISAVVPYFLTLNLDKIAWQPL